MNDFDPELMSQPLSIFPNLEAGDTIGFFARIAKKDNDKHYVCVVWNDRNCKRCKETTCPFKRKEG